MKLFPLIEQGSPEWLELRTKYFTASTLGGWLIEEPKLKLTKDQIAEILTERGVSLPPAKAKVEDFVKLLPLEDYVANLAHTATRDDAWQNAIERRLGSISLDEEPAKETWAMRRGKLLEPDARVAYEKHTALSTIQVGFAAHDSDDFGASPDALALALPMVLIPDVATPEMFTNGVELKCHIAREHIRFLRRGGFREEHFMQVQASMASTGIREWHLFGYHPELPPLFEVFKWDETTDKVEGALLSLSEDYWAAYAKLQEIWRTTAQKGAA